MSGLGYQVRKSLDRVGFEADKKMRASRVRAEATRTRKRIDDATRELGEKVLQLAASGVAVDPSLHELIGEIRGLDAEVLAKQEEIATINAEEWVAPPPPPPITDETDKQTLELPATQGQSAVATSQRRGGARQEQPVTCPNCRAAVRPESAFCSSCGTRL